MVLKVCPDKKSLGKAAATQAPTAIRRAIYDHGTARVVAATAASQSEFLDALIIEPAIDWARVELFHLDEYIGLPATHPCSFRQILLEPLVHNTSQHKQSPLQGGA